MNKLNIKNSNIIKSLNSNKIYLRNQIDLLNKFNRFGYFNPYTHLGPTREYIFFTKPDLHIYNGSRSLNSEIASDPFFIEMNNKYYSVLKNLQKSYQDTIHSPFIPLITNLVKSNLDLPSISSEESESSSNIYGTSISYIRSSERSDENHEFSLEFDDTNSLELYMLFKAWDEYERKKDLGIISPPSIKYIENKELHDQVSVYKIIVGEDGESIIYYAKLFGVYPKGVPRDTFSSLDKDGGVSYSINFHAEFVEDMNPLIISDFNQNILSYKNQYSKDIPFYDENISGINGDWCHIPYIYSSKNISNLDKNIFNHYKLRWR